MGHGNRPKKLTRQQKIFLTEQGMDATKYRVLFDTDKIMILVDKKTGEHIDVMKEEASTKNYA